MSDASTAERIDGFEYLLRYAIDDDGKRNRILQQNREALERGGWTAPVKRRAVLRPVGQQI